MLYIMPQANSSGAFSAPQTTQADGLIEFPRNFLLEFYKEGKQAAGFVTIEHDGKTVTSCVWNENAYLAYLATLPEPSLAEVQKDKLTEINAACDAAITAGCDVTLSDGTAGHISLTQEDQINLTTAQAAVQGGATGYPYHLDGELCKIFAAADILTMASAATAHILYHTTYCNHLRAWVSRCVAVDDVKGIAYGGALPADLAASMQTIMTAMGGGNA